MPVRNALPLIVSALFLFACDSAEPLSPPVAKMEPKVLEAHGHTRIDNYYWLKYRDDPEVIAYLRAENDYADRVMAHAAPLREKLYEEIVGRIKQDDSSVPYKLDDYYYYQRFEPGREYPIYCRKRGSLDAPEEIVLDSNELAEGHEFFSIRPPVVSPGQDLIAFGIDTQGRRFFTIHIKNLSTGEILPHSIARTTANLAWANDNRTLFYGKQHPDTLRSHQVYRHVVGNDSGGDTLVYEEPDETFRCFVTKTKSRRYLMIASTQTLSSEFRFLDADDPAGEFKVFHPRERNHEYQVDHYDRKFYIRTNLDAGNFRLMETPVDATGRNRWTEVIPHRPDVYFAGFEIFRDHLVLRERREGLVQLRIRPWSGEGEHYVDFGEPAYLAYISSNYEFDTPLLRYGYTSLTTPNSIYDYHMDNREKVLLKRDEVVGDFDPADYRTARLHAPGRDGTSIPISIVHRADFPRDGSRPLLLYGYGSYGASMDATFDSARLSLLDRGFAYAIAHIRGGQELGRQWYEDGKLLRKKNSFYDFIDCAEFLIGEGYTGPERLFAAGGSAGGLLMGAVVNLRPELFRGVVAYVPWVDVVTTMLDPDIPLTTSEYDEWGDPNQKEYYDYMLSYSPYDNLEAKEYPNLFVTTGLHDSQVQYWEPAKWVAKLRAMKTDDNLVILRTNMEAGHSGATGRFRRYEETARVYAFLLDLAGLGA
jgi:oligopeptidase B